MRMALNIGLYLLGILNSSIAVMAQPLPPSKTQIYSCTDALGVRITADRPIAQCADREQRVLSSSGIEQRRLGPTLTEIERIRLQEQQRLQHMDLIREKEFRRKEAALLARYPTQEAHEAARQAELQQFVDLKQIAMQRLAELDKEARALSQSLLKSPATSPMSIQLKTSLEAVHSTKVQQLKFIDTQETEMRRINDRFDAQQLRLSIFWYSKKN